MKLPILLILFLHEAPVQSLREVSGYPGEAVTLPSGADPSWTLSNIEWSILLNDTWIATYRDKRVNVERVDRYKGRLSLNTSTGDLTIRRLTAEDDMEYTVDLINTEGNYTKNKAKVTVRQRLQKPIIRRFLAKNESCSWFLQCSSTDTGVALSWQVVPQNGTFINMTKPDGNSTVLSTLFLPTTNRSEITCTSRRNMAEASSVSTLACDGEEPEPGPTLEPQPKKQPCFRKRYSIVFLVGCMLGFVLTVIMRVVRRQMHVIN